MRFYKGDVTVYITYSNFIKCQGSLKEWDSYLWNKDPGNRLNYSYTYECQPWRIYTGLLE